MSLKHLFISILLCLITLPMHTQTFTVMIDPTGDAQHTGREISDTFERGITLQCAQELKKQLSQSNPDIRVILTRVPGETIQPLHNALFANRLQVQLYIRIGFYHESNMPPHMALFYYCENKTDFWHRYNPLQFYHITQAHLMNLHLTKQLGTLFLQKLQNNSLNPVFSVDGLFGIPLKPMIGIQAPALYIEAGLHTADDWKYVIKPIITCIQEVAHHE